MSERLYIPNQGFDLLEGQNSRESQAPQPLAAGDQAIVGSTMVIPDTLGLKKHTLPPVRFWHEEGLILRHTDEKRQANAAIPAAYMILSQSAHAVLDATRYKSIHELCEQKKIRPTMILPTISITGGKSAQALIDMVRHTPGLESLVWEPNSTYINYNLPAFFVRDAIDHDEHIDRLKSAVFTGANYQSVLSRIRSGFWAAQKRYNLTVLNPHVAAINPQEANYSHVHDYSSYYLAKLPNSK